MRDWVALFTYFLGNETFSSFTKVFGVAEPENQSPGLANLIRFSRLLNSKPSWVLTREPALFVTNGTEEKLGSTPTLG